MEENSTIETMDGNIRNSNMTFTGLDLNANIEDTPYQVLHDNINQQNKDDFQLYRIYTKMLESPTATCDLPIGLRNNVVLYPYQRVIISFNGFIIDIVI
jgi:hypothetical protein